MNTPKPSEATRRLQEAHDTAKQAYGTRWPEVVAEFRGMIEQSMEQMGTKNPLDAVLPVAFRLNAQGKDPRLAIAVAFELAGERQVA